MVDVETKAFFTSLGINGAIALVVLFIFCWLRNKYDEVYEPRRQTKWRKDIHSEPPSIRPGLFGWITHTYHLTDDQVYQTAGLDAVMYIKFFGLVCRLFIISMIPALLIWLPVNQTDNNLIADPAHQEPVYTNVTVYNATSGKNETILNVSYVDGKKAPDDFSTLSVANIHNGSNRLLLPLLGLWLFTLYALYLCRNMWIQYMHYRHLYLSHQQAQGQSLSLLVHNLPPKSTTQTMSEFFKSLYPTTFVSAVVSQNVGHLPKLITERDTAIAKLERAHYDAEHVKPGASPPQAATKCLCCGKVDAIEHWETTIQRLNDEIAVLQMKEKPYYGSGFVTFNSSFIVSSLSKLDQTAVPYEYQCNRAPDADDVYHANLRMNRYERIIRTILFTLSTYALVLFWIFPVAFAASFANLKALAEKAAFLSFINSIPEGALGLIQGYMPAIILAIFYFLLPIILLTFARNQGIEGHTWQSISVVKKMFIFMVVNYFLVFAISGSLFNQLAPILEKPLNLPSILGVALPSQANAFATIILFKGLAGFPIQSLQIGNLVGITILRKYLAKTEREKYNASKPADMNYSAAYPNHLFILILGCVYVVMAPIITVFASIYFSLGYLICKYQAVYMIVPVRESGGRYWPVIFGRIIASLIVGQLTMIGLFGVKEYAPAAILSIPVPIITYYYYHALMNAYTNKCDFLPVKDAVATDATRVGRDVGLAESRIHLLEEKTHDDGTSSSHTITHRHTHIDPYTQTELLIGKATIPKTASWSNRDLNDPFIISSHEESRHQGSHGTDGMAIVHITRKPSHSESDTQQVEIHHNSSM